MRINDLLLTIHIVAAAAWIGVALALQVLCSRLDAATDDAVVDRFAVDAEALGRSVIAPASGLLLVSGVALVIRQDVSWTAPWILVGLGAFALAGAVGVTFLIPEAGRIAELARTPGHDPREVRIRNRRRFLVARLDLSLLLVAVAAMVFRVGA